MNKQYVLSILFLSLTLPLLAAGKPPPKKETPVKEQVKKDLSAAKKAANDALDAVDQGVHKAIKSVNEAVSEKKK